MPELPDVTVYVEALRERTAGHKLTNVLIRGPFLLRSVEPPVESVIGKRVTEVRRVGKRIAIGFDNAAFLVLHLMIAGRLHWRATASKGGGRNLLAEFQFDSGFLTLTEAGTSHRASLHIWLAVRSNWRRSIQVGSRFWTPLRLNSRWRCGVKITRSNEL